MKLTINKLIANDIINYGMDNASEFNYIVYLDSYLKEYDDIGREYILENLDDICEAIKDNERIADFYYDEKEKSFDMDFYWGYVLNDVEQLVLEQARELHIDLGFEDIREIANDFIDNEVENLVNRIKTYDNGREMDLS